jgi:hypothetical protein
MNLMTTPNQPSTVFKHNLFRSPQKRIKQIGHHKYAQMMFILLTDALRFLQDADGRSEASIHTAQNMGWSLETL